MSNSPGLGEPALGRKTALLAVAAFLGVFASAFLLLSWAERSYRGVEVVVDARVSASGSMQLFVNEQWSSPLDVPVAAGERRHHVFRGVPDRIVSLRLDLTATRDATAELHGVQVRSADTVLASYTGRDVASWSKSDIRVVSSDGERAVLRALTDDPILSSRVDIAAVPGKGTSATLKRALRSAARTLLGGRGQAQIVRLMFPLLLLVYALGQTRDRARQTAWLAVSLAAGYLLAFFAFRASMLLGGGELPTVNLAVGHAAYAGVEKNLDFRGFLAATCAAAATAVALALGWSRLRRARAPGAPEPSTPPPPSPVAGRALLLLVVAFACVSFPEVLSLQSSATAHSTQYDSQNLTTWAYFRQLGLLPFRDFWYCYGGFHFLQLPHPPDVFYRWIHQVLLVGAFAGAVLLLADLRVKRSLLLLAFAAWLVASGFLTWDRYLVGLAGLLLWGAALHRDDARVAIAAGAFTGYVFFIEPNQLAYMAPGALLLLAAALRERPRERWRSLAVRVAAGCAVAAAAIAVQLAALWRAGALGEFVRFYGTMGEMAKYGMFPAPVGAWFFSSGAENLLLSLTLVLVMISACTVVLRSGGTLVQAAVPAAVALLALLAFQKQLMRPHIAAQVLGIPALGIGLALLLSWRSRLSSAEKALVAGCAGAMAAIALSGTPVAREALRRGALRLAALPADVAATFDADAWRRAREGFMAPARFVIDDVGGAELAAGLRARMSFEKEDDLFVLGDDSYLYILLGQRAPFYVSLYNTSILYSQEDIVSWIRERRPKYVLWRSEFSDFDAVPNVTRVPLIFAEVITSYSPVGAFGKFTILQRRPGDGGDFGFWRERLGSTVELGFIPSRSQALALPGERPDDPRYDVLSVEVQRPVHGRTRDVVFDLGSAGKFSVRFLERNGTSRYAVVLDRVWFWALAKTIGVERELEPDADGARLRVSSIRTARSILY